jgi:translation initiation factor 1
MAQRGKPAIGALAMGRRRDDSVVYSSAHGRMCPNCARSAAACVCRKSPRAPQGDGKVRVRREVKGRRGKTVTTIAGVPLASDALRALAAELKRRCGSGGSVSDGVIEIQGDHRDILVAELESRGYRVLRAGG